MIAYQDPAHPGNGPQHHTGKECIEPGCTRPAGTRWSPLWCFECNVKRMDRISASLKAMVERADRAWAGQSIGSERTPTDSSGQPK